jgi:hypothetical protein
MLPKNLNNSRGNIKSFYHMKKIERISKERENILLIYIICISH